MIGVVKMYKGYSTMMAVIEKRERPIFAMSQPDRCTPVKENFPRFQQASRSQTA